jgi:gliding motility-associated protein GldL
MAKKNSSLDKILQVVASAGASVVIMGALCKILHVKGADMALIIGMSVEAFIFLLFAFQAWITPAEKTYEWEKVYPELEDDAAPIKKSTPQPGKGLSAQLDATLSNAKVEPELIDSLGKGLKGLTDTVAKITNITDATVATNEYAKNVKTAAATMIEMNKSYGTTMTAMNDMAGASQDAKEYRQQFGEVTKKMGALNAVYELELQDTNRHLKAMNAFYGNLSSAMENMASASKDTQQFKQELAKLTANLNSLNGVYGGMLSAMKGN